MEFKHPKYYAALRAELRKLQAAEDIRAASLKHQAIDETVPYNDIEEAQASSSKQQASSPKQQASSFKPQATSSLIREPRNI